jgi:hypothetical protein
MDAAWHVCIGLKGTGREAIDWINLVEDREKFRAFVNAVMNLRVL